MHAHRRANGNIRVATSGAKAAGLLAALASLILASCGATPSPSAQPSAAIALPSSRPSATATDGPTLAPATPAPSQSPDEEPPPDDTGSAGEDGSSTGPGTLGVDWVSTAVEPRFYDATMTARGVVAVGEDRRGGVIWLNASGPDWGIDDDDASLDGARLTAVDAAGSTTIAIGCDLHDGRCRGAGIWIRAKSWARVPTGSLLRSATLVDVAVGDGHLMAIGRDRTAPAAFASTNGTTWTRLAVPPTMAKAVFRAITTDATGFVVVGSLGKKPAVWTSTDGSSWRAGDVPDARGWMSAVVRDQHGLLAGGGVGTPDDGQIGLWRSTDDGASWSTTGTFSPDDYHAPVKALTYSTNRILALDTDDQTALSTDGGNSWVAGGLDSGNARAVAGGSDSFIAVGDGDVWTTPRVAMNPPLNPLGSAAPPPASTGWSAEPSMPALAPGDAGASDGQGRILIFSPAGALGTLRIDRFAPGSGRWTRLPSIKAGIRSMNAVYNRGTIYLIGLATDGRHGRTIAYNPKTGAFRALAPLPTPREHPGVAVGAKDGAIYVFGGRASPCCANVKGSGALATVERFDPKTGRWTRRASMPWPDTAPSAAGVGSTIYVFLPARVWMYEPATDRWKPGPTNLSYGTMGQATVGADGLIRVFTCERYDIFDPTDKHWQPGLSLMTPRCNPVVAIGGDSTMYVFGGQYSGDPGRVVESAFAGGG